MKYHFKFLSYVDDILVFANFSVLKSLLAKGDTGQFFEK